MSTLDYDEPFARKLNRTDPYGNQTVITPSKTYKPCFACNAHCDYLGRDRCWGSVTMLSDTQHLCDGHKKMGNPSGYYVSEPQKNDGPLQRMLGEAPEGELSNWGGELRSNKPPDGDNDGKKQLKEDSRYES